MKDEIILSVIVPVYNTEGYLEKCIQSILMQNMPEFELLLVNDGSTDRSGEICDEYAKKDSRIVVHHKPNGGVSSARNIGLDIAQGDYIIFVDSDDILHQGLFSDSYATISSCDADILFYTFGNSSLTSSNLQVYDSETAISLLLASRLPSSLWLGIYTKKLFEENRLDNKIHFYEDLEFQIRLVASARKILHSQKNFYTYSDRDGSANNQSVITSKVISSKLIYEKSEIKKLLNNKQYSELRAFIAHQIFFYGLKSRLYPYTLEIELKKTLVENLRYVVESGSISFKHKAMYIVGVFSFKFLYNTLHYNYIKKLSKV